MRALRLVALIAVLVAGCGPRITYRHDGQPYRDRDRALAAVRLSHANMVAGIAPAQNRVGGTLNMYVPSKSAVLEHGIRKSGEPRYEILEYVAETAVLGNQSLYDALIKRNSFDRVVLQDSDGQHITPQAGERVVYLYMPNAQSIGWFFSSNTVKRERVQFDMTKPSRAERVQYWIDSVEALARVK